MKLAIMQPYFLPYIGYFQLMAAADVFIVYDNIKYTKKGWFNRNRMLLNGSDSIFSLPLKQDSDSLNVVERELSPEFNRNKLLSQFRGAYGRAPHFLQTFPWIENIVRFEEKNLFHYIYNSIVGVCSHLNIKTEIKISSQINIDHDLKNKEKVVALCHAVGAETYLNSIGGVELYSRDEFRTKGIALHFIKPKPLQYSQFSNTFVPWLSILDVLMFNPLPLVQEWVAHNFEVV